MKNYLYNILNKKNYIQEIPLKDRTYEICLCAVKNNTDDFNVMAYVPSKYITKELCYYAIKNKGCPICTIDYIPDILKTKDLYLEAIKTKGLYVLRLPEKYQCYEFYFDNLLYIEDITLIPEQFIDYNLCFKSIEIYWENIKFIPEKYLKYELCFKAVKCNGISIKYVPEKYKTNELCIESVKTYFFAILYINKLNENICFNAIKKNIKFIKILKEYYNENSFNDIEYSCELKYKKNYIDYICGYNDVSSNLNYKSCFELVKKNGKEIEYLPDEYKTEELCDEAVKTYLFAILYVKKLTPELCFQSIINNIDFIENLKESYEEFSMFN